MKLHLVTSKDPIFSRMAYIQIRNGFAYATDTVVAVKMPIEETILRDIITPDEHLYISAKDWQKAKFHEAQLVKRDGIYLTSFNKKYQEIATIKTINEKEYEDEHGRFPDVDSVIPDMPKTGENCISSLCINPLLFCNLYEALNTSHVKMIFTHKEGESLKSILCIPKDSNAIGLIFPIVQFP